MDEVCGTGWRLVLDARHRVVLPDELQPDLAVIRIGSPDLVEAGREVLPERDGVLASWFDRHECCAAIVRPDHYVFGAARKSRELAGLNDQLKDRLR
jgi:3-(3-hydroxy-phenyl)propionate hydroxylase